MKRKRPTLRAEAEAALFDTVLRLKTQADCAAFFRDLCTPAELEAMADRWTVARMLVKGTPYRTIAENTGVSVTTVTRVARFLNAGSGGYLSLLAEGEKDQA